MSMSDLREYKCPACGGAIEFDACSAHLTEVHPHSTAEFRDLCEVVQRAVDTVQTVRHSVHKAA